MGVDKRLEEQKHSKWEVCKQKVYTQGEIFEVEGQSAKGYTGRNINMLENKNAIKTLIQDFKSKQDHLVKVAKQFEKSLAVLEIKGYESIDVIVKIEDIYRNIERNRRVIKIFEEEIESLKLDSIEEEEAMKPCLHGTIWKTGKRKRRSAEHWSSDWLAGNFCPSLSDSFVCQDNCCFKIHSKRAKCL